MMNDTKSRAHRDGMLYIGCIRVRTHTHAARSAHYARCPRARTRARAQGDGKSSAFSEGKSYQSSLV